MVSVLPNSSAQLLDMYLRHAALLNGPAVTCTWERCVLQRQHADRLAGLDTTATLQMQKADLRVRQGSARS